MPAYSPYRAELASIAWDDPAVTALVSLGKLPEITGAVQPPGEFGVDYAWSHPSVPALTAAKARFACRYLSWDASKNLNAAELAALRAAGITVVPNWEYNATDFRRGYAGGWADAREAKRQAKALGLWPCVIYFSCDYDAPPGDQPLINAYLDGAADGLAGVKWVARIFGRKHVGMYGPFWPVSRARAAGKASYYWGTVAWSGNNWATCGWVPNIMQGPQVNIGGVSCDTDRSNTADFGQWPRPVPGPAQNPVAGLTAHARYTQIDVTWTPLPGASSYQVRAWLGDTHTIARETIAYHPTATLHNLKEHTRYRVSVWAKPGNGSPAHVYVTTK